MARSAASSEKPTSASSHSGTRLPVLLGAALALILCAWIIRAARTKSVADADPLKGDMDSATVALAAVLAKTPVEQRPALLRKSLNDPATGLRFASIDELMNVEMPDKANQVEALFQDNFEPVRQRAMEVLPNLDRKRGLQLQLEALRDEDSWIREAALSQMESTWQHRDWLIDKRDTPELMKSLDDPDIDVVTMTTDILKKLTGQPWRVSRKATPEQRAAAVKQWKQWWAKAEPAWPTDPRLAYVSAITPTRIDAAPDFNVTDIEGNSVSLAGQHGHLTLLNFWGTWCPPCQSEIPDLVKLDQNYRSRGLDIIGIALGEKEGETGLRNWCKQHAVAYRQAMETEEIKSAFGHIEEVPVSILIDANGKIRYRWEGERDYDSFRATVERILKDTPPTR